MHGDNWGRGGQVICNALKLTPPPAVKEVVDANTPPKLISQEVLPQFAADHMFVTTYETKQEDKDKFFGNAVCNNFLDVKNNPIYEMTFEQMYYYDPLAIEGLFPSFPESIQDKFLEAHGSRRQVAALDLGHADDALAFRAADADLRDFAFVDAPQIGQQGHAESR